MSILKPTDKKEEKMHQFILQLLEKLNMTIDDLRLLGEVSPYLILDGHRSGMKDDMVRGYMEGAEFSLRFATIMEKLGGKQASFLIHTLRNYKTMDRMKAIFEGVEKIA